MTATTKTTAQPVRLTDAARAHLRTLADAETIEPVGRSAGYRTPDGFAIDVPEDWVEPVPPRWPEPDDGTVVRIHYAPNALPGRHVAERDDKAAVDLDAEPLDARWWVGGESDPKTWEWVTEHAVSVEVLVPESQVILAWSKDGA